MSNSIRYISFEFDLGRCRPSQIIGGMSIVFVRGIFPICLFCRRCHPYRRCYIFLGRCRLRQTPIIQYLISCYCKIGITERRRYLDRRRKVIHRFSLECLGICQRLFIPCQTHITNRELTA